MGENVPPSTTKPLLILIVDDDTFIVELLAELVMEMGYTPLVAYDGEQALAVAREHWPALVITDQVMPILSGIELIRALRVEATARKTVSPPIVLLSGAERLERLDVDVEAKLAKPFDLGELEQVIQRLCERASS